MKESPVTEGKHTPGAGKSTLADDLRAARALIDTPEKWRKGGYGYGTPCLCASAAICVAVGDHSAPFEHPAWHLVLDQIPQPHTGGISSYNDDPATTHADIMALFDRAIAKATGAS